jgi:hypothetical protein
VSGATCAAALRAHCPKKKSRTSSSGSAKTTVCGSNLAETSCVIQDFKGLAGLRTITWEVRYNEAAPWPLKMVDKLQRDMENDVQPGRGFFTLDQFHGKSHSNQFHGKSHW